MEELEVNGTWYRTGKLDAFKQFHLFRKLMPLFSGMGETAAARIARAAAEAGASDNLIGWASFGPVAQAIADMTQSDSEFIIKTCLAVCQRKSPAGQWVRLATPQGDLMFEDIDLTVMLQLSFAVIQDNLAPFFPGRPLNGSGAEVAPASNPSI
jgi:hypothetical protein